MKRSNSLKLTLMLGSVFSLSGCGDSEEQSLIFTNVDDCTAFGIDQEACQAQYQQALENHATESPKYATEALCENDFGFEQCENRGSIWQPIMAGFMLAAVAEAVDEGLDFYKKKKRKQAYMNGGFFGKARPLYRSKDDYFSFRNANNQYISSIRNRGTVMVKKSKSDYPVTTKRVTTKRGGFGRSASSRSSWGG
ncbi:predicted integral membrane protein [Pseudoalteromonas luteoviolacea B = ATCC 29581]|nr:predicted integral membrane protein [Pseudoalteromonas luteoviolacea B = ATCC 29581]